MSNLTKILLLCWNRISQRFDTLRTHADKDAHRTDLSFLKITDVLTIMAVMNMIAILSVVIRVMIRHCRPTALCTQKQVQHRRTPIRFVLVTPAMTNRFLIIKSFVYYVSKRYNNRNNYCNYFCHVSVGGGGATFATFTRMRIFLSFFSRRGSASSPSFSPFCA